MSTRTANSATRLPAPARSLDRQRLGQSVTTTTAVISVLMLVAVLVRLAVAGRFPPHVDEGNMLLGIQTVAQKGYPLLPSNVLYLHGATLSYLLAPLSWLGMLDYSNLFPLRAVNAIFGGAAVWLTFRLAREVIGSEIAALVAAALVALDPLNVLWGGFIRMYALLQVLALVIAWLFLRYLQTGDEPAALGVRRKLLGWFVVAFWLSVFTQVAGALLLLPIGLFALIVFGKRLFTSRRDLTIALVLASLAPVLFLVLSSLVGHGSTTTRSQQTDALPGASFLGDDALDFSRFLNPAPNGFTDLYAGGPAAALLPILLTLACGIVIGGILLARSNADTSTHRFGIGLLLLLFWTPITLFAFFVAEQKERYLLNIQPFGYIVLAAALALVARAAHVWLTPRWPAWMLLAALGLVLAAHTIGGLWTLNEWGVRQTQAGAIGALEYVRDHRGPNDVTIVGSTPESVLMLGLDQPMYAMGGVLERPGSTETGVKIDDWAGLVVIDSAEELCPVLKQNPGTWFYIGQNRLDPGRVTTDIALGSTERRYESPDGYLVLHSVDPASWTNTATQLCQRATS